MNTMLGLPRETRSA